MDKERALQEFADQLEIARALWQRYPKLIEAENFPEPFLTAFRKGNEDLGPGDLCWGDALAEELEPYKAISNDAPRMTLAAIRKAKRAGADDKFVAEQLDIVHLEDREKAFLTICQRIYREDTGCTSPADNFIIELIHHLELEALTPKDLDWHVEQAKDNWEHALRTARKLFRDYPELISEAA